MYGVITAGLMSTCLLSSEATAEKTSKQLTTSAATNMSQKSPIMAVESLSNGLVAVGTRGRILINHGDTQWQSSDVTTDVLLTGVSFAGERLGWVVGHDATILNTIDGGESWSIQQSFPDLDRPLLDVMFVDEKIGFAVGAYGMFFKTVDGGKSWHKKFLAELLPAEDVEYLEEVRSESEEDYQLEISSILPHFNKIKRLKDNRLLLVGELGLIAFSPDNGRSWQRRPNIYEGSFFTALETKNGALLIGGLRGHVFRSIDNGVNWLPIELGNSNSVNDISQMANGDVFIAQNNGVILKSIDEGKTFFSYSAQKGQDMMSVVEFNQQIWMAGSKGLNRLEEVK